VTPPAGRLPQAVVPTHYTLELTIDPRQERFAGRTRIDVDVRESVQKIWLHGLGLEITAVYVSVGGAKIPAAFTVSEPVTGVARLDRLEFALANTPRMIEDLEHYFGIAFPYQKLDLISSPQMAGAMENAGALLYDDNLMLLEANHTPTQRRNYGETHAHELAHQWFGDLVTPQWWDDIWLNEA